MDLNFVDIEFPRETEHNTITQVPFKGTAELRIASLRSQIELPQNELVENSTAAEETILARAPSGSATSAGPKSAASTYTKATLTCS